jgi:hypothetical protein
MKLTVDYLLNLLDEVTKNVGFDYVKPGSSKVKLLSVNHSSKTVSLQRVTGPNYENANISKDTLSILVNSISENIPFSIESVLKGSGNKRSVYEAILARTSEFYKCTVGRIKHLVWVPSQKHPVDKLVEISLDELQRISGLIQINTQLMELEKYRPYITAIKTKPFLLLAGISGTGKSRIVRELARACWDEGSEEYKSQKPKNFEMVQVKPNWHDSSELIGYVSRIDGVRYVVGPFLKFMVKAINDPNTPYFLCLDEMNLAPVEQYFAEYLSVVESRKWQEDGTITTDPIVDYSNTDEYKSLIDQLFPNDDTLRGQYLTEKGGKRLSIPSNLIVVGTVNMDETTFSFSRKVLDRAMTLEMNEVDLYGGLDDRHEKIGKLEAGNLIGTVVEGVDVYQNHKDVCDIALRYLIAVNQELDGTPFKVAYRTRNEFLLYVVNNLPYSKDKDGNDIPQHEVIARALDEITSMKVLSRIEGDESKIGNLLDRLTATIGEQLKAISEKEYSAKKDDGEKVYSVSLAKLKEMTDRLNSGYTSFWS